MERIADYAVGQQLAGGSSEGVWLCTPPARLGIDAAQVAVKVIDQSVGEQELQAVTDELRYYASAMSSELATLYEVGQADGKLFVAMEYFSLGSLGDAQGAVDARAVARVVADAARGVHALHEVGIAHRNVKPTNLMLHGDGGKLADIGLLHLISPGKTVTGVGAASAIGFIEPGIMRGEKAARASDIWSLGACLHHSLTGTSVYGTLPDDSLLGALRHVLAATPQIDSTLPEAWQDIVRRCIAPDRGERYPTALALAEDIGRVEGLVSA